MKSTPHVPPTIIVVAGCLIAVCGALFLYRLTLTAAETSLARAFGVLILGTFLVVLGYAQHLFRERGQEPSRDNCEETPNSTHRSGGLE